MIKEIVTYIAANTSLAIGSTIFAGFTETDAPLTCVIVEEVDPAIADYLLTDRVQKPIRIISRGVSYWTARNTADTVFDLLHGKMQLVLPVVISGVVYCSNVTGTRPYYMGKDADGSHMFVSNFMFLTQLL
jgi:hypothetical protein